MWERRVDGGKGSERGLREEGALTSRMWTCFSCYSLCEAIDMCMCTFKNVLL